MSLELSDILGSLASIQTDLRGLISITESGAGFRRPLKRIGCRLLHWSPKLEHFRAETSGYSVYQPFDIRVGSRPHVFFTKVYKTRYITPEQKRSDSELPERQFGITYTNLLLSKSELAPTLDGFKKCAIQAGALVGSIQGRLESVLPPQTLAAKNDLHRWIFTVYDVAWEATANSDRSATKYIPVTGFDASMHTEESLLYDLKHLRTTRWKKVERRLDPKRHGEYSHLKDCYASWSKELPEYYGSRLDDVIQASDWAIDWLLKKLHDAC